MDSHKKNIQGGMTMREAQEALRRSLAAFPTVREVHAQMRRSLELTRRMGRKP